MSETELRDLCDDWQKRLRVQDWDVELVYVSRFDMGEWEGECIYHLRQKIARIRLLSEDERQKSAVGTQDMETRLVHELLHLQIAPFEPEDEESAQYVAMEQAVNALAACLVGLKREAQVCGRSYDGKCPMPRPEPVPDCDANPTGEFCNVCSIPVYASDPQVNEGGQTWHYGCYHGKKGPRKRREHAQEQMVGTPMPLCAGCGVPIAPGNKKWECVDGKMRCDACYEEWLPAHEEPSVPASGPLCHFCKNPFTDRTEVRIVLLDDDYAHLACWNGRQPGWRKVGEPPQDEGACAKLQINPKTKVPLMYQVGEPTQDDGWRHRLETNKRGGNYNVSQNVEPTQEVGQWPGGPQSPAFGVSTTFQEGNPRDRSAS